MNRIRSSALITAKGVEISVLRGQQTVKYRIGVLDDSDKLESTDEESQR